MITIHILHLKLKSCSLAKNDYCRLEWWRKAEYPGKTTLSDLVTTLPPHMTVPGIKPRQNW